MAWTVARARLNKLAQSWTQIVVARRVGVHRATISLWISGDRTPTAENMIAMRNHWGIPIDDWFVLVEEPSGTSS